MRRAMSVCAAVQKIVQLLIVCIVLLDSINHFSTYIDLDRIYLYLMLARVFDIHRQHVTRLQDFGEISEFGIFSRRWPRFLINRNLADFLFGLG